MKDSMQEKEIVRRCQNGDVSAYKKIYDRYEQPLLHTALRMLGHQQDAEDAVQTTFIRLFRGIRQFRHEAKFSTYLFRILMNVCLNELNRKKRMRMQTLNNVIVSQAPTHDLRMQLERAVGELPEQQKACFVLFAMEEIKQEEIAEMLGLSLGGVKSNIHHAKKRLRSILGDERVGGE